MVGRVDERRRIEELLATVRGGGSGILLLVGEPGIGKTRLAEVADAGGCELGIEVRSVSCVPLVTPLPLEPIVALLLSDRQHPGHTPAARREPFTDAFEVLEQRRRLGPMLLVVDDLQWADQETIGFLRYSFQRGGDLPVGWVVAARPGHVAELLADDLHAIDRAEVLRLTGLDLATTGMLAREVVAGPVPPSSVLAAVHARTGGNPFLTIELLRAAALSAAEIDELVPVGVRGSVAVRRRALDPTADEVLRWCAVLPQPARVHWLQGLAGDEALGCLAELVNAAFVRIHRGEQITFTHQLLRDAVVDTLLEPERRDRHARIADLLVDEPAGVRAPQLLAAGRYRAAAQALLELADEALLRGGAADAVEHARQAEGLAQRHDHPDLALSARDRQVLALLRLGRAEEAHELATSVRHRRRRRGGLPARVRFLARYTMACWDDASDLERAVDALDELVALLDGTDPAELAGVLDDATRTEAVLARAHVLNRAGRSAEALPLAEQAAERAPLVDPVLQTRALVHLALIRGLADTAEVGMQTAEAAIDAAQEHRLPAEEASAWLVHSYLAQAAGDEEAHERSARRGLEIASVPPSQQALLLANAAQGPLARGELDRARAELERAMTLAARVGAHLEQRVAVSYVHALQRGGELDTARALLATLRAPPGSFEWLRATYARALVEEEAGELTAALRGYALGVPHRDHPSVLWSLAGVVRVGARLGELDTAADALEQLEQLSERWPVSAWLLLASRGHLAVARGQRLAGARQLEAAAEQRDDAYQRAQLRLDAALAREDAGAVAAAVARLEAIGSGLAADHGRQRAHAGGLALDGVGPAAGGAAGRARPRPPPLAGRQPQPIGAAALDEQRRATSLAEVLDAWEAAPLRLRLLGALRVERAGEPIRLPPGRPSALVGLLALEGGAGSVARLVDQLWPEQPPAVGRSRLRQVLYRLRREVPGLVERLATDRLALREGVARDLDVLDRLCALAAGDGEVGARAARAALALVRGPVLDGVPLRDPPVELDVLRTGVDARRRALHDRLASAAEAAGDLAGAADHLLAALRDDPTNEARAVRLVRLLSSEGRDAEADGVLAATRSALQHHGLPAGPALREADAALRADRRTVDSGRGR